MFGTTSSPGRRRPRPALRARPRLELLEARDVPHALALTPLVEVSGPSPFLGHPVEANDPPFGHSTEVEPYVAVDPTNSNHLVGAWIQDFARGIVAAVSFDGGAFWQSVVIPGATQTAGGPFPHSSDPWVTFSPSGDVYLSLIGHDVPFQGTPNTVLVSKSIDGGLTWGTPTHLITGVKELNDKETITADPYDSRFVYAAWSQFDQSRATAMFSRTTDGGQNWEPARAIYKPAGNDVAEGFQIVVLPDGTLVNVFTQQLYSNDAGGVGHFDFKLSVLRSSDRGQNWQATPTPGPDILPLGDVHETTNGFRGVNNPDDGLGIRAPTYFFDVAVDPANGNLYAVWPDARFGNSQYTGIAFSMSTDGGLTWSAPIKINQTPDYIPAGNRSAFMPSVAVNQDGVVAVTYYDFRNNTPASGVPTDVWMVHAHPSDGLTNPASWSSENRMTPVSFDMQTAPNIGEGYFLGDYQGLVAQGKHFGAFFSMPSGSDLSGVFYRDPLPVEETPAPSVAAPGTEVRGQLLVRFESNVTPASIADFYADHGLTELENLDFDQTDTDPGLRLVATPMTPAGQLIPTLQLDPCVRYAESNVVIGLAQFPNDPTLSRDYGLVNTGQTGGTPDADTDADEAWDITTGSSEVVVAVLDSGIDYTHPDLAANMWTNPGEIPGNKKDDDGNGFVDDVHGYDIRNNDSDPMDTFGHGTAVAGTIGMVGNNAIGSAGVSWNIKLMAVTMRDEFMTFADAIKAMDYVTMMRNRGVNIRVANASWGAWDVTAFPKSLKDAVDRMGEAGILFVAAANNQARDVDIQPHYPSGFDSPHIVSVAATDHNDRYCSFTNWGATTVDLAAGGEFVWTTGVGNTYTWADGTSFAAPHVAGAAALIFSAFPNLNPLEVKARLLGGVDPIGHIGANAAYPTLTNGRLNVRNALLWTPPDGESVAPSAIGDLAATSTSPWSAILTCTATGDDGTTGRAISYDVRYSSAPITEATWSTATPAPGEPAPGTAGSIETLTVSGLEPGTLYYFAIKVKDNDGNVSALSNIAQGATAPAAFLLNDDVESGAGNWTATGMWHRSNVRGHDSATAWYLGNDSNRTYFNGTQHQESLTLATPIDLSGVTRAILRFDEWRQVGDFLEPLDASRVMASRNGADWTIISESFHPTIDWEQRTFDLAAFVGGRVYIRFDFNVNAYGLPPFAITQGYEGWHVDNIQLLVPGTQATGFSVSDFRITEGDAGTAQAVFTVTRSSGAGRATVGFATADGTATAASGDYQPVAGTLTFQPGELRKTVAVTVNGDRRGEFDESFVLNLHSPSGADIADGQGRGNIRDDEPRIHATGLLAFPEGDKVITLPMAVNLSVPSTETVTVHYATADLTAVAGTDYLPTSGVLTFAPGETRKLIDVTLQKDMTLDVVVEAFVINFSDVSSNAVILKRGVVHIVDDGEKSRGNHFGNGGTLMLAGLGGWPMDAVGVLGARMMSPAWAGADNSANTRADSGWFEDRTSRTDSEFIRSRYQFDKYWKDVLKVMTDEAGCLLMADKHETAERLTTSGVNVGIAESYCPHLR